MLKSVEKLINAEAVKVGNHSRKDFGSVVEYYYHQTAIIIVDSVQHTVIVNDGGWGTSSTTRAINSYLEYYKPMGYEIIDNRHR